jgi:hypothetical protein
MDVFLKRTSNSHSLAARDFLFLVCFAQALIAQPRFEFSGYVADLPVYDRINESLGTIFGTDRDVFLNITRLRLRPTLILWEGGRISLEHEIDANYQSTSIPGFQIQAASGFRRQAFDLRWDPVTENHFSVSHFVDRLYFRQNFTSASIVIGRQRIAWGTGRIWNPTDLFNPINPASFDRIEKDGADAASFKYYLGNFTALEAVYNTEDKFKQSNWAVRFQTNVAEYDLSILSGRFDRGYVVGGDFAGNFYGAGLRGEGIYSESTNNKNPFVRFIFGADYQFTSLLYGLIEYQYNGEGTTDKTHYDILGVYSGQMINAARDYIFLSATYQPHPLVTLSLGLNTNLNDGSGFLGPSASYSIGSNMDLDLGGLLTYGSELSEYWYYPGSLYLKGVWYY